MYFRPPQKSLKMRLSDQIQLKHRPFTAMPSFLMVSTPRRQNQLPSKSPEQQYVRQQQQQKPPNQQKRWNLKTAKRHLQHQDVIFNITGWQPAQYMLSRTQCKIINLSLSCSETSKASHKFHLRGSKGMALLTKHGKRPNSNLLKFVPLSRRNEVLYTVSSTRLHQAASSRLPSAGRTGSGSGPAGSL